jgi:serine/threonine protein kinase
MAKKQKRLDKAPPEQTATAKPRSEYGDERNSALKGFPMNRQLAHPPGTCPPLGRLRDFVQGELTTGEIDAIAEHVASCVRCEETVRGDLADNTLEQIARRAVARNRFDGELSDEVQPAIDRLIHDLVDGHGSAPGSERAPDLDDRVREVCQFLDAPAAPDSLGQLAGYEIRTALGAGATSVVFQAHNVQLQRTVALKVLRPSLGFVARQRFLQEARAAASIEHENVVTIYEVGQQNSLAFIAMQWNAGQTLEQYLEGHPISDAGDITEIARQIAAGLAAAHRLGMIHRDIKPANIWMDRERRRIKLLDFGLARIVDDNQQFTETGMIAGTPAWMSPEQAAGARIDHRSDLFSLGCVMYRMATGRPAFQGGNVLATLQLIRQHHPVAANKVNPAVPESLSMLIECLLSKNPDHRPQSADDFIAALDTEPHHWRFPVGRLSGEQSAAVAPSPAGQGDWGRRGTWILAVVLLLVFAAGAWLFGPQIVRVITDQGQVVIQSDDPDIQIEVRENGNLIEVVDLKTRQSFNIRSGEYVLKGVSPENEVTLSANTIIVTRGGKQVVQASTTPATQGSPVAASGIGPVYDGQPIEYYLELLRTEKNLDHVTHALKAVTSLQTDDYAGAIRMAVLKTLAVHGNSVPRSKQNVEDMAFQDSVIALIGSLPPDEQTKIVLGLMDSPSVVPDTTAYNTLLLFLYSDLNTKTRKALAEKREVILDRILMGRFTENLETRGYKYPRALLLAAIANKADPDISRDPRVIAEFTAGLETDGPSFVILQVIPPLVSFAPETPGLAERIASVPIEGSSFGVPGTRFGNGQTALELLHSLGRYAKPVTAYLLDGIEKTNASLRLLRSFRDPTNPEPSFDPLVLAIETLEKTNPDSQRVIDVLQRVREEQPGKYDELIDRVIAATRRNMGSGADGEATEPDGEN